MMPESIILHIPVSEEYDALYVQAREQAGFYKCRCWFDRTAAIGDIQVEITGRDIAIRYETKKGPVAELCQYSAVTSLTELRHGIVLRLSKGRMLFLPAGGDREYMSNLIRATMLMESRCAYRFRDGAMTLPGVGLRDRIRFRLRPNRGFVLSGLGLSVKLSIIAMMCFALFIGTVFATQPLRNRQITPEEAESITAVYTGAVRHSRRGTTQSVELHFQDHPDVFAEIRPAVLWDALDRVDTGSEMELLIHPDGGGVLQVRADGVLLLDFDSAMETAWNESLCFLGLGLFMYFCAGYIGYEVFLKKKH